MIINQTQAMLYDQTLSNTGSSTKYIEIEIWSEFDKILTLHDVILFVKYAFSFLFAE